MGLSISTKALIDRKLNSIENKLTNISPYPVIGTLAGVGKVTLGVIQSFTAFAFGILCSIPAAIDRDWSSLQYSWTHIKHGMGNIMGGVLESIPVVQTVLYWMRELRKTRDSDGVAYILTHHEGKYMPYRSLVLRDWTIDGVDDEAVTMAKERYKELLLEEQSREINSVVAYQERRLELGRQAVRECQFV